MMSTKSRKPQKLISLIFAAVFLCSSLVSLFAPTISQAAYDPNSVSSQNDRTILFALEHCITDSLEFLPSVAGAALNKDDVSGIAYSNDSVPVGYEIDSDDGNAKCTGLSLKRAMQVINQDKRWFFKQIYETRGEDNGAGGLAYKQRSGFSKENLVSKLKNLTPNNAGISNKERQRRVARAFWLCNEQVANGEVPERTSNKIGGKTYQYKEGKGDDNEISVGVDLEPDNGKYECKTLLNWGNESWLATALEGNPPNSGTGSGTGADVDDGGDAGSESSCQGGALGWILCPMIDLLTKTTTFAANMIDSLLQFRVLAQEADNGSETIRTAWQGLLSVANIMLVLAFLVIIFSQSTSLGLSNYGIKRMLPRLILAAILINISFFICAFLVDISNIVGSSVLGFLNGPQGIGAAFKSNMDQSGGFAQALVGGVAIVAIIFFFLLPVILAVLLVLLLLIARLVILGVLIVVSPLAFAAWLLPNTESYFKKWWDLFTKLLFIYPVIMAIFGASLMFSKISDSFAPQGEGNQTIANLISLAILAIPLFVLPKILMSTNSIMGQVGGIGQKLQGKIQGGAIGKAFGAPRRAVGSGIKTKALNTEARMAASDRGALSRAGSFRARRKERQSWRESERSRMQSEAVDEFYQNHGPNDPRAERRRAKAAGFSGEAGAERIAARVGAGATQREQEEIKAAKDAMQLDPDFAVNPVNVAEASFRAAQARGDKAGMRAAFSTMLTGGAYGIDKAHQLIQSDIQGDSVAEEAARREVGDNWSSTKAADTAITGWAGDENNKDIDVHASSASTYTGLKEEQLATLTPAALHNAATSGGLSQGMAQSILTGDARKTLNADTRGMMEHIAAGRDPRTTPRNSTPPPSDIRLKKNIKKLGSLSNGISIYRFQYIWSEQEYVGVMAQDVLSVNPEAVIWDSNGFYRVDYAALNFEMLTIEDWKTRKNKL